MPSFPDNTGIPKDILNDIDNVLTRDTLLMLFGSFLLMFPSEIRDEKSDKSNHESHDAEPPIKGVL